MVRKGKIEINKKSIMIRYDMLCIDPLHLYITPKRNGEGSI